MYLSVLPINVFTQYINNYIKGEEERYEKIIGSSIGSRVDSHDNFEQLRSISPIVSPGVSQTFNCGFISSNSTCDKLRSVGQTKSRLVSSIQRIVHCLFYDIC
jgi:hypothetical protein